MTTTGDRHDNASFTCPSCGGAVDATWTYCRRCNFHPGDLLPMHPGAPPPHGAAVPGPRPRLPRGEGPSAYTPAPKRGSIVAVVLVVAAVAVIGGIIVIEAVTKPSSNFASTFEPSTLNTPATLRPSTTRLVVPSVPGSTPMSPTVARTVPAPTDKARPPVPAGWIDVAAPDGSWSMAFPAAPRHNRGNLTPAGWRLTDVRALSSPDTGASIHFLVLAATAVPTVEDFFDAGATFLATVAQSTVEVAESTTIDGKGARRFVATKDGSPTGELEAWAVYDGATAYLVMSEASTVTGTRTAELDQMVHSLQTRP